MDVIKLISDIAIRDDVSYDDYKDIVNELFAYGAGLSINDKYMSMMSLHSILFKVEKKNSKGDIMRQFDVFYEEIMNIKNRTVSEKRTDMRWLYLTPMVASVKRDMGDVAIVDKLAYIQLCTGLRYACNMELNNISELTYSDFLSCNQVMYNITSLVTPQVMNPSFSGYIKNVNHLSNIVPEYKEYRRDEKSVLLVITTLNNNDTTYRVFVNVFKSLQYTIDVYTWNSINKPSWVRDVFIYDGMGGNVPGKIHYDVVLMVNHNTPISPYIASRCVGKYIINLLGDVCPGLSSTHKSQQVYNVIPKWDMPENYSGKPLYVPGIGYGIAPKRYEPVQPDDGARLPHLVFPFEDFKFNNHTLVFLSRLHDTLGEIPYKATILLGNFHNMKFVKPIINYYFRDFSERWNIIHNDPSSHGKALLDADIIIGSYPYASYTTAVDAISVGKPFFTQFSTDNHGHQASMRILQLIDLDDFAYTNQDELIGDIQKCLINDEFLNITKKQFQSASERFSEICAVHNEGIYKQFKSHMEDLDL